MDAEFYSNIHPFVYADLYPWGSTPSRQVQEKAQSGSLKLVKPSQIPGHCGSSKYGYITQMGPLFRFCLLVFWFFWVFFLAGL